LAALRYDDTNIGIGNAYVAGVGVPVFATATVRAWGTRYVGDETFRGWRVKAGPQFTVPAGPTFGLYYSHYEDNAEGKSDGATGELTMPLVAGLNGRATATHASAPGQPASTAGTIGLSYSPLHALELSGEVGLARGNAASQAAPPRGVLKKLLEGPG